MKNKKNFKILITGINSYLGSKIANALLNKKYQLIGLTKNLPLYRDERKDKLDLKIYKYTKKNLNLIFNKKNNIKIIIHTATDYGKSSDLRTIINTNITMPLNVIQFCLNNNVELFINTDTSLNPKKNIYSQSKKQFFNWIKFFSEIKKTKFINLKFDHFYGPGDSSFKFPIMIINKCLKNEKKIKLTKGMQLRDFIYIDDLIRAYITIIEKRNFYKNYYNSIDIGTGKLVNIKYFVKLIKKLCKSSSTFNFGSVKYRKFGFMKSKLNLNFIHSLGWKNKTSLREGLIKTIKLKK